MHVSCPRGTLSAMLEPLLATYGPPLGAPTLSYAFHTHGGVGLERNGVPAYGTNSERHTVMRFEGDLYASALSAAGPVWLLHASAVVVDGRALVFAGESGDGKSTIAAAMVGRGADYVTDEWVAIDADARVVGMARPIMFDQGEAPAEVGSFVRDAYEFETTEGDRGTYELWQPPRVCHEPTPLGAIMRIRHSDTESGARRRLSPGEAITALWACTVEAKPETLHAASDVLARALVFEIVSNRVSQLCEIVTGVADLLADRG